MRGRPNPPRPFVSGVHWQVGDLAECLHPGPWRCEVQGLLRPGPPRRDIRCVTGVFGLRAADGRLATYLTFASWPDGLFDAHCFAVITPRADAAFRADHAFIARLASPARQLEHV